MILSDGKHVQGIFVYSPDVEYELGDFIVEKDCIYICKSGNPVKGSQPSTTPSLFSPYPGDMITSIEDYERYLVSPNGKEDKYISSNILVGILQDMYYGFGDSGVINSYIKFEDGKFHIDTQLLSLLGQTTSNISKPLDLLMRETTINNAYVQVSRDLLGVKNLLTDSTATDNCLLRQYTYQDLNDLGETDSNGVHTEYRYRVQEMIDFENKISYFRSTRGSKRAGMSEWQYNSTISPWSCTTVSKALLDKINQIIDYYANERDFEENTNNGFNFMNLALHEGTTVKCALLRKTDSPEQYSSDYPTVTPIENFTEESFIITVNLKIKIDGTTNVYKAHTCTFNTLDTAEKLDAIDYYYLEKDVLLKVAYTNNHIVLSLVRGNQQTQLDDTDAKILSIYYRNNGE